jgi:cobalt-precorrin-5B (C1)-methyltransferase
MACGKFERLREGVTTGACAAAAAKAAAIYASGVSVPPLVTVSSPAGRSFLLEPQPMGQGRYGVVKDAGDDPDATNGMTVIAGLEISDKEGPITFKAGDGVGIVTLPGLKVPVGEAAINPVPRSMIEKAVRSVIGTRAARVTISVPGGEERAKRTFNPRLGISGGISILGTTGVVKPMNEESIYASLTLELNTFTADGRTSLAVTFGNTGEQALRKAFGIEGRCVMQSGNYIGYVFDEMARLGFKRALLCGHPGKLLKVAAGSFNTHNRTADGRMEALCTQAAIAGASAETAKELYSCRTTEEAMVIVERRGLNCLWNVLAEVAARRSKERAFGDIEIEAAFLDNNGAILGMTEGALRFAEELKDGK